MNCPYMSSVPKDSGLSPTDNPVTIPGPTTNIKYYTLVEINTVFYYIQDKYMFSLNFNKKNIKYKSWFLLTCNKK